MFMLWAKFTYSKLSFDEYGTPGDIQWKHQSWERSSEFPCTDPMTAGGRKVEDDQPHSSPISKLGQR